MEGVKSWCLSVCFSAIIGSIILIISPNIEKQKIIKVVVSAFVLIGILSPVLKVLNTNDPSIDKWFEEYSETMHSKPLEESQNLCNIIEESTIQSLYPIFKEQLNSIGITTDFSLSVDFDLTNEGVVINNVNIGFSNEEKIKKEEIKAFLNEKNSLEIFVN